MFWTLFFGFEGHVAALIDLTVSTSPQGLGLHSNALTFNGQTLHSYLKAARESLCDSGVYLFQA